MNDSRGAARREMSQSLFWHARPFLDIDWSNFTSNWSIAVTCQDRLSDISPTICCSNFLCHPLIVIQFV